MAKRIYLFFFSYMAAMWFAHTLVVLWLFQNGFSFLELLYFHLTAYLLALLATLYFPKVRISARKALFFGIILSASQVLVFLSNPETHDLYISAIFSCFNVLFFWIPYNIMHFKFSHEDSRAFNSGIYFLMTPVIGITLQPLTGLVAENYGFNTVFIIGALMYLVPLSLIKFLPSFTYEINVRDIFLKESFNWPTHFQGMMSRINYSIVPIFTLFFIKTPREFGNFFGYLALMTAVASVINGRISDRNKNRKIFYYTFSTLAVLSFIPLAFVKESWVWHLAAGIASLCLSLASPFWMTYNLDHYKDIGVEKTMVLREVFLNFGYILTLLVCIVVFYFTSSLKEGLLAVSLLCLLLPVVSYYNKVYLK
jgi:hypothetical protein